VGGWIVFAEVGLDFDDAGGQKGLSGLADEDFTEEIASHAARIACEEGATERADESERGWRGHGWSQNAEVRMQKSKF